MLCPWIVTTTSFISLWIIQTTAQLVTPGVIQTDVPWKAGHAAVFQDPYVIIYGGTTDLNGNNGNAQGTKSVWIWNSQNATWYDGQTLSNNSGFSPQVYIRAVALPSTGQTLALASNTTGGGSLLQKLDSTVWTWNSPTSTNPPAPASGYTMVVINNTIYTYGGVSVDGYGNRMSGAVLNSLYYLDANSFLWSSGSNGPAVTDHSTCYIPSCNCLVTFGGTQTGNVAQPSRSVYIFDLGTRSWNLQVNPGSISGAIPGPRRLHSATCLQDRMVVYGGGTSTPFDSDVWVLDASQYPQLTWLRQEMANSSLGPGSRMGHSAVLDGNKKRIYIFGGWTGSGNKDTNMYIMDLEKNAWSSVSTAGIPPTSSASPSPSASSSNQAGDGTPFPLGAVIGGVVGGVAGLAMIALLGFCFMRRRKEKQQQKKQQEIEKAGLEMVNDKGQGQHDYYWRYGDTAASDGYEDDYRTHSFSDPTYSDANLTTSNGNKRISKAWTSKTGTTSTRDSYLRRSDTGDVQSSVMEMISSPSDSYPDLGAYINVRGSRHSLSTNQILSANDLDTPGQIPNEYLLQKPNEFSIPAAQLAAYNNSIVPIGHYASSTSPSITTDGAPLSSSMEVLRSIKTNASHIPGSRNVKVTHAYTPKDNNIQSGNTHEDDGDEDSLSTHDDNTTAPPIQYIPGASKQFSVATTITNSAPSQIRSNNVVPLTHHQYPSSSVPVAEPVSPQHVDNITNNTGARVSIHSFRPISHHYQQRQQRNDDIYDSVSPLDRLATLGQANTILHEERTADYFPNSLLDDNKTAPAANTAIPSPVTTPTPIYRTNPRDTPPSSSTLTNTANDLSNSTTERNKIHSSSTSTSNNTDNNEGHKKDTQRISVAGMLPQRYKLDRLKPFVIGPANTILFAYKTSEPSQESGTQANVVIKSFGRREAWERECRTLIKLKSPHVVILLEVLTIQDESQSAPPALITPQSLDLASEQHQQLGSSHTTHASASSQGLDQDGDDDHIKYVTVMERLDETLSTAIRRARSLPNDSSKHQHPPWSEQLIISIARDIIQCLIWCHEKGIAFCDLKPSNIMHNVDEPWKLIDFEASRTIGEECVGVITPRYCPPEVARATTYGLEGANGVVATASVDLWALGCVLYELETKRPLFSNTIKDETILHFVSHPSPSTPILNNGLRWNDQKELEIPQLARQIKNTHTRQLIRTLLSRDPAKRGSATQLLAHPYFN